MLCPYYKANLCRCSPNKIDNFELNPKLAFLSLQDLENIVLWGQEKRFGEQELQLEREEIEKLKRWVVDNEQSSLQSNFDVEAATESFVLSTTKCCPSCGFRATHYHGHACHHISPGRGCPVCKVHYCYRCTSTADENKKLRGNESQCKCGYWSSFCQDLSDLNKISKFLALKPYPHDVRCGCVICPDCRPFRKPCGSCGGDCAVCLGYINPGPADLEVEWIPLPPAKVKDLQNETAADFRDEVSPLVRLCMYCRNDNLAGVLNLVQDCALQIDINERDHIGRVPLHYAVDSNSVEIVRTLVIQFHANVNIQERYGRSPLHLAAENGNIQIVAILLEEPSVIVPLRNIDGETPIHLACNRNHGEILRLLLASAAGNVNIAKNDTWTALHIACWGGYPTIVHLLLSVAITDVDKQTDLGNSALHFACQSAGDEHFQIAQMLVLRGASVHLTTSRQKQPLHLACQCGAIATAKMLLEMGVEVDNVDINGWSPLHLACQGGHAEIVRMLIRDFQAKKDLKDQDGYSALMFARQRNHIEVVALFDEALSSSQNSKCTCF